MIDCAFDRGVAALANHKPEPSANAQYQFDEDTDVHWIVAMRDIKSGEEIFCDNGPDDSLSGPHAGKHATLAACRRPPKWYR